MQPNSNNVSDLKVDLNKERIKHLYLQENNQNTNIVNVNINVNKYSSGSLQNTSKSKEKNPTSKEADDVNDLMEDAKKIHDFIKENSLFMGNNNKKNFGTQDANTGISNQERSKEGSKSRERVEHS